MKRSNLAARAPQIGNAGGFAGTDLKFVLTMKGVWEET
jgi:hypothetical protein